MTLIFGGAYNGKLEFVKEKYNLKDEEIFLCNDEKLNLNCKVICGLHIFIRNCVLKGIDSLEVLEKNMDLLEDKIIICDEIGSGIVPMEKLDRQYREECGRGLQFLVKKATNVSRVFFGMEEVLK